MYNNNIEYKVFMELGRLHALRIRDGNIGRDLLLISIKINL